MFKTNKLRTLLTILGISVGIGAILFLVSLGNGLQQLLINQITNSDAMLSMDVITDSNSPIKLDRDKLTQIKSIDGVDEVSPMFSAGAQMNLGDLTGDIIVNLAKESFIRLSSIKIEAGEIYKGDSSDKVVISTAALKLFNLEEGQAIGKKTTFSLFLPKMNEKGEFFEGTEVKKIETNYEIIGVADDPISSYIYLPIDSIGNIDIPFYTQLKVKANDKDRIEEIKNKIIDMGFIVTAMSETIADANRIFNAVQIILSVFGAVALLVSAIGMFNTMTIALLERTQEIGIMKALGASRKDIWKLFLAESVMIGFLGGMGGIIIGYSGKYAVNAGINFLASSFGGQQFDLFYTPYSFVFFIITFSTVVGLITGLYPANRASRLNPLEALRYK